jgi:gamma-glutamylcyclotransferase
MGDLTESVVPSPWQPTMMFFYGSLQDCDVLRAVLKISTEPLLRPATINGWTMKMWGVYPTILRGDGNTQLDGMAYMINIESHFDKIVRYETNHYAPAACDIFVDGMNKPVCGLTFKWNRTSTKQLDDGSFDLKIYQKYFKPTWAKPLPPIEKPSTLYFAYGSNLAQRQMNVRCPSNELVGRAVLEDHCWIINKRGVANVVSKKGSMVWGILHRINTEDEAELDRCEGVPFCYQKKPLLISSLAPSHKGKSKTASESVVALVYVDGKRVTPGKARAEYIGRMNAAIADAVDCGIPLDWIETEMRPFIPLQDIDET